MGGLTCRAIKSDIGLGLIELKGAVGAWRRYAFHFHFHFRPFLEKRKGKGKKKVTSDNGNDSIFSHIES